MKKILHIIDSLGTGGAEKLLVTIINNLNEFENHLLILRNPETLKPSIKNLASFENLHATSFRNALTKIPFVRKYIAEKQFSVIHSHLYESNIICRICALRETKVFNSIHAVSSQAIYNSSKASMWLEKLTYKKKHHLIHVSQTVFDDFDKFIGIKGPSTVLYNFIEDEFFKNPKEKFCLNKLKLVAVGNLRDQKNYPYLIEAFKALQKNISLDVYGEGTLRDAIQEQIDKYKLNICLKGLRNDLHTILPSYDLFVMSSHFEGQPVALLEAMACGLPPLLSDIPVLREVGRSNALYFDLKDPNSLVQRIAEIIDGQHNLAWISNGAYLFVKENATKGKYIQALKRLYFE